MQAKDHARSSNDDAAKELSRHKILHWRDGSAVSEMRERPVHESS
jgi:hypothetical protein